MSKKIVITSNLSHPHLGGVENSIRHLADEGCKMGDEIIVVSSNQPYINATKEKNPINAHELYYYDSYHKAQQPLRFILNLISAINIYKKVRKKHNPSTTIARYHLNVIAARLAGLNNIIYLVPGVVKHQDNNENRNKSNFVSLYINKLMQWIAFGISDKVAAFSETMVHQIQQARKGTVVSRVKPGISLERFFQEKREETFSPTEVKLLCIGRLVVAKGFHLAIEALSILPSNYMLTIVGDGEERADLEALTIKLNLQQRVHFVGSTNTPEEFYKKSDIFVFTSTYEPFGQTLLEATASKLPVVAFEPSDFVNTATKQILGEYAFYASGLSVESLAHQIQLAHKETFLEKRFEINKISNLIAEKYTWSALYNELRDFPL